MLVVDDEAGIRKLTRNVLQLKGFEGLEAENGLEALEVMRRLACDVVITDQVMPGMNGLDLIGRLSAEGYPTRYLLISGFGGGLETSGVPFLAKPFTVNQLLRALEKLTSEPTLPELEQTWRAAKRDWDEAIAEMDRVIGEIPSNIPHPDGSLIIQKAGQKRKALYEKYQAAYRKYIDALK